MSCFIYALILVEMNASSVSKFAVIFLLTCDIVILLSLCSIYICTHLTLM